MLSLQMKCKLVNTLQEEKKKFFVSLQMNVSPFTTPQQRDKNKYVVLVIYTPFHFPKGRTNQKSTLLGLCSPMVTLFP